MKVFGRISLVFCVLLLVACSEPASKLDNAKLLGVHYWNTSWEDEIMENPQVKKFPRVYLHVFDVVKEPGLAEPVPSFVMDTIKTNSDQKFIPIAYLTIEALQYYMDQKKIPLLASRISNLLSRISDKNEYTFDKFILDFDWNLSNQSDYFNLLDTLKLLLSDRGINLGATLRLHQLRLSDKMKSPPLDTLLLMCYNMSSPQTDAKHNSIFDAKDFETYTKQIPDYPLELEYILPVYSQVVLFRKGKVVGLLRDMDISKIETNNNLQLNSNGMYEVTEDTYLGKLQLLKGDLIKVEELTQDNFSNLLQSLAFLELDSPVFSIFDAKNLNQNKKLSNEIQKLF